MKATDGEGPASAPVTPPRLWTVAEANARLPELEELLPRLRGWVSRLASVEEERQRLVDFWGTETDAIDQPDHELKARLDAEWRNLSQRLEEAVGSLRAEGIEVKDLATGLVDFYAVEEGELLFLCWQRGEPSIGFCHSLTGGYRGRRPIAGAHRTPPARTQGPP